MWQEKSLTSSPPLPLLFRSPKFKLFIFLFYFYQKVKVVRMASNEFRIVVVGAGGVGKSALTVRFIQGNFVEKVWVVLKSYKEEMITITFNGQNF